MGEIKYFISYAREDSETVRKLAKELRQAGVNLWLDQIDIIPGNYWESEVEKALETCKGLIAVMSPESVVSNNVKDEWASALNKGKQVIPILIKPCKIWYRFERLQYADLTKEYDAGVARLLRAVSLQQPSVTQEPDESADDLKEGDSISAGQLDTDTSDNAIPQEKAAAFWREYNRLPAGPIRDAFLKQYRAMGGK